MSEHIIIKGVASYHPDIPQVIDISKRNVFLFGVNGTGKSTISNYLYNCSKFPTCSLSIDGNYTPLVYNQTFIDDNFANSSVQEGVFTLSKDNADLEKRIIEKSQLKESLANVYRGIKEKIALAEKNKEEAEKAAINEVYEKKQLIQNTTLDGFLTGFKTPKKKFYTKVKGQSGTTNASISELDREYQVLNQHDKTLPSKVVLPAPPLLSYEDLQLLKEPIVGSSSSQLTEFIEKLDNLGWVKHGVDNYLNNEDSKCPFCQENTIDESFRSEISALFDKTYEASVKRLKDVEFTYRNRLENYFIDLNSAFTGCSLYDPARHDAQPLIELLKHKCQENLSRIASKIQKPSVFVELDSYDDKLKSIENLATQINDLVTAAYNKVTKFKESENDIRNRMWDSLKFQSKDIFSVEDRIIKKKNEEIDSLKEKLERVKRIGEKVRDRIIFLRSKTSNLDDTIDRINENLKSLGVTGFEIVKSMVPGQENFFVLSRGEQCGDKVFHSLSEGEKTLITFLYFIEKCNGSLNKDSSVADNEKLIVIDDPISSLSQNYIYDIASLIQSKIISGNRFKKVIILTHSMFFFHELLKLATKKQHEFKERYALYRLAKNKYSAIYSMERNELKNDYQSLWQIVKDVVESKTDPVVLPNVMRNILEYYFGFVHRKEQLADILNELAEKEPNQGYKSFYRYINRGSHSDPTNIGFMVNVEPEAYLERFKKIFSRSQDEEHFECMMG
ncbi:AAA family ATPase [Oceanimonas smirnovii]|uniref:AAA family ATPase n=1 Tax=Oceanimonas smirnovii TaxID=264574 RepID=UPI003AAD56E9